LPPYILRWIGIDQPSAGVEANVTQQPPFLESVIRKIETLREQPQHQERAHESLVEDFFVALGYQAHRDIIYRQGCVDIRIQNDGRTLAIIEVKRQWDISRANEGGRAAIKQAYTYAQEQGVRYVVVTNGSTYILFDRLKGLSWESNFISEFCLMSLADGDLAVIDKLRPQHLSNPDIS
jgi:Holliday junction resolvase-like predicted endonuclease